MECLPPRLNNALVTMSSQLRNLLTAFEQARPGSTLLQLITRLRETAMQVGLLSSDSIGEMEDPASGVRENKPDGGVNGISNEQEIAGAAHQRDVPLADQVWEFLRVENRDGSIDLALTVLDETAEKLAGRVRSAPGILLDVAA